MSAEAELKIKTISRKIETKADAFWFGVSEMSGKITGGAIAVGIIIGALYLLGVLPADDAEATPTHQEADQ